MLGDPGHNPTCSMQSYSENAVPDGHIVPVRADAAGAMPLLYQSHSGGISGQEGGHFWVAVGGP